MNNPHAAIRTPGDLIRRYSYQFEKANRTIGNLGFYKGWFDILVQLCADIDAVLTENRHGFRWVQIKEKFGAARFQYDMDFFEKDTQDRSDEEHRIYEAIFQLVHAAESRTAQQCIVCGSPGTRNEDGSYMITLCDFHRQLLLNGGSLGQYGIGSDDLEQALR